MSTNPVTWRIWKWLRDLFNERMNAAWKGQNLSCPNCKQLESHGNVLVTAPNQDGLDVRTCQNCNYSWLADFTPEGLKAEVKDEESL